MFGDHLEPGDARTTDELFRDHTPSIGRLLRKRGFMLLER